MSGESQMWDYLGPKLRKYGHFERIESHETAIGTPDVNYCINGYNNYIELKHTKSEKKGFKLRPSQCGWFKKRVKAGGQPWLLAQSDIPGKSRGIVLIPGTDVPPLIHTTSIMDWLRAGVMVWKDKIDIDNLIQFLKYYLVVNQDSDSIPGEDSSSLILPSHLRKN
ncbi:hypothetical protein LCGC14_0865620 [marine sediment metagenome]|uniref:Protein NO VEIN C-terminal domain-containing protein n=1 Tax=marine sediment metagenome TaxID=412755 RepID=A0A0F9PRM9_9ZZZZ